MAEDKTAPSPNEVRKLHVNADTDGGAIASHHTLGIKRTQASPGDHLHDGGTSKQLMDGITITGAKGGNVALTNLITKLADALGFTDGTT